MVGKALSQTLLCISRLNEITIERSRVVTEWRAKMRCPHFHLQFQFYEAFPFPFRTPQDITMGDIAVFNSYILTASLFRVIQVYCVLVFVPTTSENSTFIFNCSLNIIRKIQMLEIIVQRLLYLFFSL